MPHISWEQHPTIADQVDAVVDGSHVAWIRRHNWGGHYSFIVKSYIARLNNYQFDTLEDAQSWVAGAMEFVNLDKGSHQASNENVRIGDLDRVKHLVKIKKLAELAGLNPSSIAQKVGRRTELTITESEAMTKVMVEAGVIIERR